MKNYIEEFEKALEEQGFRGSNPYFPDWEGVKQFITEAIQSATLDTARKIGSYYELKNLKVIEDFCNSRVREIV